MKLIEEGTVSFNPTYDYAIIETDDGTWYGQIDEKGSHIGLGRLFTKEYMYEGNIYDKKFNGFGR